ncbi:MAG: Gfo/Idh/MocA family protein, partial [Persicimonas sp.]
METRTPKIACLGVGWIGRHRMERVVEGGAAEVVAVCDPNEEAREAALEVAPTAEPVDALDDILDRDDVDGVMIATPSALHAEQAIAALGANKAVFCQKPLGRDAAECARVVS